MGEEETASNSSALTGQQRQALATTAETGVVLIQHGLISLADSGTHRSQFVPLLLLAQGFERLLKIALLLDSHESGEGIALNVATSYRHRIGEMTVAVIEKARARSADSDCLNDLMVMFESPVGERLLRLMDEFAGGGRYFDLDSLDPQEVQNRIDPVEGVRVLWLSMSRHPARGQIRGTEASLRFTTGTFLEVLQRFGRGLARFIIFMLGDEGERLTENLAPILYLQDADLRGVPPKPGSYPLGGTF